MKIKTFILLLIVISSCKNFSDKKEDFGKNIEKEEIIDSKKESDKENKFTSIHLKDTIKMKGNAIVILRPDSLRFNSYLKSGKKEIYEVDSDFGFGITKALNSFSKPKIKNTVTNKRYIKLENCKDCPKLIDRDTIDYGIIMSSQNKKIKIDQNIYGAEYYLELFNNYFEN